jgi:DNA-binding MarR family transcriptional regulator
MVQTPQRISGPLSVTFTLSRLGSAVADELATALEPLGIEPRTFRLLRILQVSQGESQRALAELLGLHPSRMVILIDELEKRKLVRRRPHASDRRAHTIVVTPGGKELLKKAFNIAVKIETRLCSGLADSEREQLLNVLEKLRPAEPMPEVHAKLLAILAAEHTG